MRFVSISIRLGVVSVFLGVFGGFSVVFARGNDQNPQPFKNRRQAAETYMAQNDYAGAMQQYRSILSTFPDSADARNARTQIVRILIRTGDMETAAAELERFRQTCSRDPKYPDSVDVICREYRKKGRDEEALSYYRQARELSAGRNSVKIRQGIIEMLIEKGDLSEADGEIDTFFSDCSDQADDFTRSFYPILNRCLCRKDYNRVVEIGRRALQKYPEHGNAFSTRTVMTEAFIKMKKIDQADALVEDMFTLYRDRPDFVSFMHAVKSAYWKSGQQEKSQVLCRRLLSEFPQNPMAAKILGDWICGALVLGQEEGVNEKIETLFSRYTEPAEDFLPAAARIQERYLMRNDYSKVIETGRRALEIYPDHPETVFVSSYMAQAMAAMGAPQQASQMADTLISKYGDHPQIGQVLIDVGHAFRRYGLYRKSVELYQQVQSAKCPKPEKLCALTGMAQSCIRMGKDKEAMETTGRILSGYRGEKKLGYSVFVIGEEYYILAEEAFQVSNQKQAEPAYRKAVAVWEKNRSIPEDPKHQAHAAYYCGRVYQTLGEYEKAMDYYREVLEKWPTYEKIKGVEYGLILCYQKMGDNRQATLLYNRAALNDPSPDLTYQTEPGFLAADSYCGAYAVWHLLRYYGRPVSIQTLVRQMEIPQKGYSTLQDIAEVFAEYEISVQAVQIPPEKASELAKPFVQYRLPAEEGMLGHFVLCIPIGEKVLVLDGQKEPKLIDLAALDQSSEEVWDGTLLLIETGRQEYLENDISNQISWQGSLHTGYAWFLEEDSGGLVDQIEPYYAALSQQQIESIKGGCVDYDCLSNGQFCYNVPVCAGSLNCTLSDYYCTDTAAGRRCMRHPGGILPCITLTAHTCSPELPLTGTCTPPYCDVYVSPGTGGCGTSVPRCRDWFW